MSSPRYPTRVRRPALLPGLVGAVATFAGVLAIGAAPFTIVLFLVSILAAIVAVFAFQARQWWWLPVLAAVVVVFNPVFPLGLSDMAWLWCSYATVAVFAAAAALIRIVEKGDARRDSAQRR
jgi:hypothetical protein